LASTRYGKILVFSADQDGGRVIAASAMPPQLPPTSLTHLNTQGQVHMVEVGERPATRREARAEGVIAMLPEVLALVLEGCAPKGDVLAVARVAAIQAAKRTWELIPLCHPIALSGVDVAIEACADGSGLRLEASARTTGSTGVEMEALTAVQVGLLTLYDMLKSADPAMTITSVRLLSKSGGRHGDWQRPEGLADG
jgi:cyclic pyranopterin phosphate synthase